MKKIITLFIIICGHLTSVAQQNISSVSSGNWNDAATWSTFSVPTANDNVTISAGNLVTTNSNACCYNLSINTSGSLIGDSAIVLNVKGSWFNSGTYNSQKGTIAFNGTNLQSIGGNTTT